MSCIKVIEKSKILLVAFLFVIAMAMVGCSPQETTDSAPESNDTVARGEYTPFDPNAEIEVTDGKAIEGSEEEELQQERIAGGAVGEVVSENLEPLTGVIDNDGEEYEPKYGDQY